MANTTTPAVAPNPLVQKFYDLEGSMNGRVVERGILIKLIMIAVLARTHLFILGTPGTGKSFIFRTLRDHIGGLAGEQYYEKLLTRTTKDSELFGVPDLAAMEKGVSRRVIEGMLPTAVFAFLDEIFKCNSSALNALLMILNERVYHNDVIVQTPLSSMFCASNETPQGDELEALYDRIHFRAKVVPIGESGNFIQMLRQRSLPPVTPVITLDEILEAQAEVAAVKITNEVFEGLDTLRKELKSESVEPTDRRFSEMLPVIQATAWWRGATEADIDDMRLIRHGLWTREDEAATVNTLVLRLASPLEADAQKLRDDVEGLAEELEKVLKDSDNPQQRNRNAIDLHGKLDRAGAEIEEIEKQVAAGGRQSELVEDVKTRIVSMTDVLLETVFNIDPDKIQR